MVENGRIRSDESNDERRTASSLPRFIAVWVHGAPHCMPWRFLWRRPLEILLNDKVVGQASHLVR